MKQLQQTGSSCVWPGVLQLQSHLLRATASPADLLPLLVLQCLINFAMALAEMKQQQLDAPSASMLLVNLFQLLYVLDGLWNEVRPLNKAGVSVENVLLNGCPPRRPS